jgi:hypothetical protein
VENPTVSVSDLTKPPMEAIPDVERVIARICCAAWGQAREEELIKVAQVYYYFSIQFRENLEIACEIHPNDKQLKILYREECNTDNLSPWPGISAPGEQLNHDEFMRRLLLLQAVDETNELERIGEIYLRTVRDIDRIARARSIASYEDAGLSRVFTAILQAPSWNGRGQQAFRFFLERHIQFDSNDEGGHGALSRHLRADGSILPLWRAFEDILNAAVPRLWDY